MFRDSLLFTSGGIAGFCVGAIAGTFLGWWVSNEAIKSKGASNVTNIHEAAK